MMEGKEVELSGEKFIIPPLNFNNLEALEAEIQKVSDADSASVFKKEYISAMKKMIHAAISQNYPEVTLDHIGKLLTPINAPPLIQVIMGVEQSKKVPPATAPAAPSTGDGSAPISPPAPDGAGSTLASE